MNNRKLFLIGSVLILVFLLGLFGWRTASVIKDSEETRGGLRILEQPKRTSSSQDSNISREEERTQTRAGGSGSRGSSWSSETENNDNETENNEERILKTFEVSIQSEEKVYAINIKLNFDKNKVEIINIAEGNFLNSDGAETYSVIILKNEKGKANFALTRFETREGISGEGIFAIIKFKALTTEKNEISFEEITLVDSNLNKLEFQFIDGKIIVI